MNTRNTGAGKPADPASPAPEGERIAKRIARSGLCSRRDAERLVAEGRVVLNGKKLDTPAVTVGPKDRIVVDGTPLAEAEPTRLWLYHKQKGTVTTNRDPQGRPTVFQRLPADLPRVVTIGRLDINTEGLLLLTNDGGLARLLELPKTGWLRRYRVRVYGLLDEGRLERLKEGITIDGVDYGSIEVRVDRQKEMISWLTLGLREGKNREVKKVLEWVGLDVTRLIRVSFGPFMLGDLAEGQVEEVKPRILRDQLGQRLAEEAGVQLPEPAQKRTRDGGTKAAPGAQQPRGGRPAPAKAGQKPGRPDARRRRPV